MHAMREDFQQAIIAGVERLTAWADLLDRINVFPIPDGDTGRNLVISLSPLRRPERNREIVARDLLLSARGNSGNIASAFFQCFIQTESLDDLPDAVRLGCERARQGISEPQPGTMLSFFDALAAVLPDVGVLSGSDRIAEVLAYLETAVRDTTDQQPKLRKAGVVDAGALGMFLFFEGFLHVLAGGQIPFRLLTESFHDRITVSPSHNEERETGYCVDTVLQSGADAAETGQMLTCLGEAVIVTRRDAYLKIHFHTRDCEGARRQLVRLGQVIDWMEDDLHQQTSSFAGRSRKPAIHIMTDAAGSLTRREANDLGVSLLDSYITVGDRCLPETYFNPDELYSAMRSGIRVTTAQASIFERHQTYESVMSRHALALYLCVGSAFTGNYPVAMEWKREHDPENRLLVLDTGAASGRLGLLVHAVAAVAAAANEAGDAPQVMAFARQALTRCEEYVFLDRLEYLAAGGRLSKTGAFVGDLLHRKPIVSPLAEGVRKVGVARNREEQVRFALDALDRSRQPEGKGFIMLEYSDNRPWVEEIGLDVARRYPNANTIVRPLSLTSGAHMGPGTWAVALLPEIQTW